MNPSQPLAYAAAFALLALSSCRTTLEPDLAARSAPGASQAVQVSPRAPDFDPDDPGHGVPRLRFISGRLSSTTLELRAVVSPGAAVDAWMLQLDIHGPSEWYYGVRPQDDDPDMPDAGASQGLVIERHIRGGVVTGHALWWVAGNMLTVRVPRAAIGGASANVSSVIVGTYSTAEHAPYGASYEVRVVAF